MLKPKKLSVPLCIVYLYFIVIIVITSFSRGWSPGLYFKKSNMLQQKDGRKIPDCSEARYTASDSNIKYYIKIFNIS